MVPFGQIRNNYQIELIMIVKIQFPLLVGIFLSIGGKPGRCLGEEPLKVFVFAGQSNMVGMRSKSGELSESM